MNNEQRNPFKWTSHFYKHPNSSNYNVGRYSYFENGNNLVTYGLPKKINRGFINFQNKSNRYWLRKYFKSGKVVCGSGNSSVLKQSVFKKSNKNYIVRNLQYNRNSNMQFFPTSYNFPSVAKYRKNNASLFLNKNLSTKYKLHPFKKIRGFKNFTYTIELSKSYDQTCNPYNRSMYIKRNKKSNLFNDSRYSKIISKFSINRLKARNESVNILYRLVV